MDARKLTAVLAVTVLLSVAAVPLFQEDSEAVSEPAVMTTDAAIAPMALGAAGGFAIGLIVGIWIGVNLADPSDPAGSQEAVYQQCRDLYSLFMTSNMDTALNLISSVMPADTSLWSFTSTYWNRATELAVAEDWGLGKEYDPNLMTENAMLRTNVMHYIYDWQAAVDNAYNSVLVKNQKLTGDCYGDVELSINWDGGSIKPGAGANVYIDLAQAVTGTQYGQLVYLHTYDQDVGGNYNTQTSGTLYAYGNDVVMTYVGGGAGTGTTLTVQDGVPKDVTSYPSGLYRIESSGAFLAGPLSQAVDGYVGQLGQELTAADVVGTMLVITDDDVATITSAGDGVVMVRHNGSQTVSANLTIDIDYTGKDASHRDSILLGVTDDGQDYDVIGDWNAMVQSINNVIVMAAQAGEVIWGVFDAAEESNSFISPSSVSMTIPGVELKTSQSQAVYVQAMMQIADYWERNEGEIVDARFETNADSLSVYVYCDIYLNGQLFVEDAIVTPYMSVDKQLLEVGKRVEWDGTGFAMMWAQGFDLDHFNSQANLDSSEYQLLDMSEGYVMEIKQIVQDGKEVDSITLEPVMILMDTTGGSDHDDPPEPVKVMNANTLIILIFLLVGLISFLVCERFGHPIPGLVLALIIVLIGLVGNDWLVNGILYGQWWKIW